MQLITFSDIDTTIRSFWPHTKHWNWCIWTHFGRYTTNCILATGTMAKDNVQHSVLVYFNGISNKSTYMYYIPVLLLLISPSLEQRLWQSCDIQRNIIGFIESIYWIGFETAFVNIKQKKRRIIYGIYLYVRRFV